MEDSNGSMAVYRSATDTFEANVAPATEAPSILPKGLEPFRCQVRVSNGMLDILVAEVMLQ
jgi:hypothetical protein